MNSSNHQHKAGFTLPEVMITTVIVGLVILGAFSVLLLQQKMWVHATLRMDTSRSASLVLERMVYGAGNNSGLRAATAEDLVLEEWNNGDWRIKYDGNRQYWYTGATDRILDEGGPLFENISDSTAVVTNGGVEIMVAVQDFGDGRPLTSRMSTFIQFRN